MSIFFFVLSGSIYGAEDCTNGIDDDGDGLIDLLDTEDCSCSGSTNILIEKSFEEQSCCPVDRNYSSSIDCLDEGWFTPTGSIDYFHTCGYMGDAESGAIPMPLPSGDGIIGFATFTEILGGPFPFYESIANCLDSPMSSGQQHEVSFYVGFGPVANSPTLDITLALYGKTDCVNLFVGDDDCMPNYNGWELITEIPVSSFSNNNWVFASQTFIPNFDYTAIGIATTCGNYPIKNYNYLDAVKITGPSSEIPDPLVSFGDCIQGVTVEVLNNGNGSEDYQWYLDGVAIVGANSNPHFIQDASAQGEYQVMVTADGICKLSEPLDITIDETILDVAGVILDVACNGESSGNIDLSSNSTNTPITFEWDNGTTSNTGSLGGLSEGQYEVTVTDANGCFDVQTFVVNEPLAIEIQTAVHDTFICNGTLSALLETDVTGGEGSLDFLWSTGETTTSLSDLGEGSYTVSVTDQNGCLAEQTYTIQELPEIEIEDALVEPDCNGGTNGSIDLTITGGMTPYDFLWEDGSTTSSKTGLSAGDYSITVTDSANCTQEAQFTLSNSTDFTVMPAISNSSCDLAADGSITLNVDGADNPTFLWEDGSTASTLDGLPPGMYSVVVSDGNNCDLTIDYEVVANALFEFQSMQTEFVCNGSQNGTIDLQAPDQENYTYLWSNGSNDANQSNLEAGNYSVVITNEAGCENSYNFEIDNSDPINLEPSIVNLLCSDGETGSISITVSGGQGDISLNWNTNETTNQIANLSAGIYDLTAVDELGCEVSESFVISGPAPIVITENIQNAGCDDEAIGSIGLVIDGGNGPYDITWSTGETTSSISGLSSGSYSVEIVDANGCAAQQAFDILDGGSFAVNVVAQNISCFGETNGSLMLSNLTGVAPYDIQINGQAAGLENLNLSAGSYLVEVIDGNGCNFVEQFILTSPNELNIGLSKVDVLCFGELTGELSLTISEGVGPYQVFINGQLEDLENVELSAGEYKIQVFDANNCMAERTEIIEEPEQLQANSSAQPISCPGISDGEISIEITGGLAPYTILNEGSVFIGVDLSVGDYNLTIQDVNGCLLDLIETVEDIDIPELEYTVSNPDCGQAGEIEILNIQDFNQDVFITNGGNTSVISAIESDLTSGIYFIALDYGPDCLVPLQSIEIEEKTFEMEEPIEQIITINEGQNQILSIEGNVQIEGDYEVVWQIENEYNCVQNDDLGNCVSIEFLPVSTTNISAILTTDLGCEQSFLFNINVELETNVFAPNIISANNDDTFKLYTQSDMTILESFSVYTRWGERIYVEEDISINDMKGWDLKYKDNTVGTGVYVYIVQYQNQNGEVQNLAGDITVVN